jgi:uncharacterized membrane protein YedE/YeeE
MTEFTPWSSALGGLLIGIAAAVLWVGSRRIAGISGIVANTIFPGSAGEVGWRSAFVLGLPIGAAVVAGFGGPLEVSVEAGPLRLIVAGLLVGFGTRLGNGCTSGHGVCGLSRGSVRSLVATMTFMAAGAATVFVFRHLLGAFE